MKYAWFRRRGYQHFDRPVRLDFAEKVTKPEVVSSHSFSPLIRRIKANKRYKRDRQKTVLKERPITYASHKDACILSYYSSCLGKRLEKFYQDNQLTKCVIAYRALGKGNYNFAAEAWEDAKRMAPAVVLAFDVENFFDTLNHAQIKSRLKRILEVSELSDDWFKVFRFVTRYRYVEWQDLENHPRFGLRTGKIRMHPIATVRELKHAGIIFKENPNATCGIPQGTPISAMLSNLYMIDFDLAVKRFCDEIGGSYRRYSDDILIICKPQRQDAVENKVKNLIESSKLMLNASKTEITGFGEGFGLEFPRKHFQYLGFNLTPDVAYIRPSSLARQQRMMRREFRRTRSIASEAIKDGRADRVFTKKLRKRFAADRGRNFRSYAKRSSAAFGRNEKITRQLRRFGRDFEVNIRELKTINKPKG